MRARTLKGQACACVLAALHRSRRRSQAASVAVDSIKMNACACRVWPKPWVHTHHTHHTTRIQPNTNSPNTCLPGHVVKLVHVGAQDLPIKARVLQEYLQRGE